MKKSLLAAITASLLAVNAVPFGAVASVTTLQRSPQSTAAASETKFDEDEFYVAVGTCKGATQLRYFAQKSDGSYTVEKVVWEDAPADISYGDVFIGDGNIEMTKVMAAPDNPVYAMAYYYQLDDGAKLNKVGKCDDFMEKKVLTVSSKTYDGSAHWSIRYKDSGGKEYYYGLSNFASTLTVDPLDCEVGDVYTYALCNDYMVIPLAKENDNSDVYAEPECKIVKLPDKVEYKLGEAIDLEGLEIEVTRDNEEPVVYTYPDVAFDYQSNIPKSPSVVLSTDFRSDKAGTYKVEVVGADNVSFEVKVVDDSAIKDIGVFEEGKKMTLDDVVELSKKGSALTLNDLAEFKGVIAGSGIFILKYDLGNGYTLMVGSVALDKIDYARLSYAGSESYIDIRTDDVEAFIAEMNAKTDPTALKGTETLTLDIVKELSKKGSALDWKDFEAYKGRDVGSGLYIWQFELEDGYKLHVGGVVGETPYYIQLSLNNENGIDIRDDDVEEFLANKGYTFKMIGSMTEEELKELFAKKGLTEAKGYGVWTKEQTAAAIKDSSVSVILKPDARFITKNGVEILNEASSVAELLKYDEYNTLQSNYLIDAVYLPRDAMFLWFPHAELRTEVNNGKYTYKRYFHYNLGTMVNDADTQAELMTTLLNYLQLSPYVDGFEMNQDIAYGETGASTVRVTVLDIKGDIMMLKPVEGSPELRSSGRFTMAAKALGSDITPSVGMKLDISYRVLLETYPARFGEIEKVAAVQGEDGFIRGDANCDEQVDMADAVLIMQALANPDKYGRNGNDLRYITGLGILNGDMDGDGLTVGDALAIQRKLLGLDKDDTQSTESSDNTGMQSKLSDIVNIKTSYNPAMSDWSGIGILIEVESPDYPVTLKAADGSFTTWDIIKGSGPIKNVGKTYDIGKSGYIFWTPDEMFPEGGYNGEIQVIGVSGDVFIDMGRIYITQDGMKYTASLKKPGSTSGIDGAAIAGKTYVFEKEGFGGDFEITFNGDGTFLYSVGPLSSYLGGGKWEIKDDTVVMTESTSKKVNNLKIKGSDLIYIEEGSDNFYGFRVNDGERFFRQSSAVLLGIEDAKIASVNATSSPKGYDYSFTGDKAQAVVDYLSKLDLSSDLSVKDPGQLDGMMWVIKLTYENGNTTTFYQSGKFIKAAERKWFEMSYYESEGLSSLIWDLGR